MESLTTCLEILKMCDTNVFCSVRSTFPASIRIKIPRGPLGLAHSETQGGEGQGSTRVLRRSLLSFPVAMAVVYYYDYLRNLSEEFDSENEFENILLLYDINRGKRSL